MDTLGNTSNQTCSTPLSTEAVVIANLVTLCISAVILVLLTFLKRRVRLAPNCCHGHPGIPSPMDFLIAPHHRWIYVAILAVMGVTAYDIFMVADSFGVSNLYLRLFVKLVALPLFVIAIMVLQFAPLFVCVDYTSFKLLGNIIGLGYSLMWYAVIVLLSRIGKYLQLTTSCNGGFPTVSAESFVVVLLQDLPYLIVGVLIVIWYIHQVAVGIYKSVRGIAESGFSSHLNDSVKLNNPRFMDTCHDYYIARVKKLLKKHETTPPKFYQKIWFYLVPFDKNYKLPAAFLGAVCAVLLLLYKFTFTLSIFGITLAQILGSLYFAYVRPILTTPNSTITQIDFVASYAPLVDDIFGGIFVGIPVLLSLAPVLAFISCLLLLWHMLGSVSKRMKRALREGFKESLPGPVRRLPGSWKFVGNLIGYSVVAYSLYYLMFLLIGAVIGAFIILVRIQQPQSLKDLIASWLVNVFLGFGLPPLWAFIVLNLQVLLCKYIFYKGSEGKFIATTNRNLFNWFALILFFYNGIAGLVSAVLRIGFSLVFGLVLLFRIDKVVLMKGFTMFDFGHASFLAFFYLDYAYNNPVVHVFIKALKENLVDDDVAKQMENPISDEEKDSPIKSSLISKVYPRQRIRNLWLVGYTLARNPSLVELTGGNLEKKSTDIFGRNEKSKLEDSDDFAPLIENALL